MLWEIGPDGAEVRELRRRLGHGLRATRAGCCARSRPQGLVVVETAASDRRVRRARLTEAGAAERAELDRLSDALALSMLEPLDEHRRARLVTSMQEVERLLAGVAHRRSLPRIRRRDDARWCIEQYFAELAARFEGGFDPARSIPAAAEDLTPPAGLLLVARRRERPWAAAP